MENVAEKKEGAFMFRSILQVTFFVDDVAAATEWYSNLLNMAPALVSEKYSMFDLGSLGRIGVHISNPQRGPAGLGGQVCYFLVEDLNVAIGHFLEKGAELFRGPMVGPDGVALCQMRDPFRNAWGLASFAPSVRL